MRGQLLATTPNSQLITYLAARLSQLDLPPDASIGEMEETFRATNNADRCDSVPCEYTSMFYRLWVAKRFDLFEHINLTFGLEHISKAHIANLLLKARPGTLHITPENFWESFAGWKSIPQKLLDSPELSLPLEAVLLTASAVYDQLRQADFDASTASAILPGCSEVKCLMTCSLTTFANLCKTQRKEPTFEELTSFLRELANQVVEEFPWMREILV